MRSLHAEMNNLPNLRFILQPDPGFGVDARLPFGLGLNCFMAAESYITGKSFVAFGVEPRRFSWLRLQLVPSAKLILKPPILRLSEFKFLYTGAETTLYNAGSHPSPDLSSAGGLWKSVRPFVRPSVEIQHHNTIMGTLLDSRQRRMLQDAMREVAGRRAKDIQRLQDNRNRIMRTFDPPELPPLDPRRGVSELRKQIHERNKERRVRIGGTPVLLDELRDKRESASPPDEDEVPENPLRDDALRSLVPSAKQMSGAKGTSFVLASFDGRFV